MDEAKELGYKKLSLHATADGKALYTKFGFRESAGEMVLSLE